MTERNLRLPHKAATAVAALLDGDYTVAVSYHGNDQAAEDFNATAGIPVFKWDVAETADWAVVFLVSDDAGFIAGSTLTVNGGQHMN